MNKRIFSQLIYIVTSTLGIIAFLYPFWQPTLVQSSAINGSRANDSMLLLTLMVVLCLIVLLLEVQNETVNTKTVALLGVLVAINVTLRFVETVIPGPGGFSPIFLLIILTGYVYGSGFGFLMGVLTLFASALVTGGVGPWLPYQMLTAGWMGMSSPLCRFWVGFLENLRRFYFDMRTKRTTHRTGKPYSESPRLEVLCLALFGAFWGLLYGVIINLWFWPLATGDPSQYWQPGIGISEILQRYFVFYTATSLVWDLLRGMGNFLLFFLVGLPVLRGLRRFHDRFEFQYQPSTTESLS